ncbi:MAG: ankyrin repeat domain-containing protein, partial [Elusimicrobia bacterium]|nr:ankyrin repeat domain-containing protein [Elusimicrobiota bacterium]
MKNKPARFLSVLAAATLLCGACAAKSEPAPAKKVESAPAKAAAVREKAPAKTAGTPAKGVAASSMTAPGDPSQRKMTPAEMDAELVKMAASGDINGVQTMLRLGAHANAEDRRGLPALFIAVRKGKAPMVSYLVKAGAKVNAAVAALPGKGGHPDGTPLGYAAREGSIEIMQILRDSGADMNLAGPGGNTPLVLAAETGQVGAIYWLKMNGSYAGMPKAL